MDPTRNIFLEAAMTGRLVNIPCDNIEKGTEQPTTQNNKKQVSTKAKNAIEDKELQIIKQAVCNVGRLPGRVLRYVEMMATHLPEAAKLYYSNVGTKGGPSREAALKRISRKIKKFDKEDKTKSSQTSCGSAARSAPSTSTSSNGLDLEEVYKSSAEDDNESDADKSYIYEPAKQTKSENIDSSKWLKETNKREKRKEIREAELSDNLDVGDQDIPKKKKKKTSQKSKIDSVLDMLPAMLESVKSAANAHTKAVNKWQNLSDSE